MLTNKESECLRWAAAGKTSIEIGLIMNIKDKTVDFHIFNACGKLGVHNRQAAVTMALHYGLISDVANLVPNLPCKQT